MPPRLDLSPLERHGRAALCLSGGKDSTAVLYLLRPYLDRITVYHLDTGDLLPETRAVVAALRPMCPNFVHIQGDVQGWIAANGLPTDLLPHSAHPVGATMGEGGGTRLVGRYDCCYRNLMLPIWERIRADGHTLSIRGTKAVDMAALPATSGTVTDGVEVWLPLRDWSHAQVLDYLRNAGAPINPIYAHVTNSPECARCPAWWNERRAAFLRERHPELFREYRARLHAVTREIHPVLQHLAAELREIGEPDA